MMITVDRGAGGVTATAQSPLSEPIWTADWTEHSLWDWRRSVWRQGIKYGGDLQQLWPGLWLQEKKTRKVETRGTKRQRERGSDISSLSKQCVELEYFYILICDLRIYLDQTRGDSGKTNQDCCGDFDSVPVQYEQNEFYDELTRRLSST